MVRWVIDRVEYRRNIWIVVVVVGVVFIIIWGGVRVILREFLVIEYIEIEVNEVEFFWYWLRRSISSSGIVIGS